MNDIILTSQKLYKSYHDGTSTVEVLKGVDLAITKGDRIAIIGPSGSGKSTLLHLLGGLDKPTSGLITLGKVDWQKINEKQRCQLRNQQLGFVYQFHHLLPEFTALENVMMPLLLAGMAVKDAEEKAINMLEQVGLKPRLAHKPAQLSGGERQRVAIARALVHQPHCVLADEPTGNLDEATASKVFDLMLELNKKMNTALVIVTHDQRIAERMDRVLVLHEGSLYARE
ncbi:TPA: lipoprotein-releasing ABC transporter ATP-binding protein LolD [Legionella pneumophila]|uniref:Lipoprotein-releasing system ATP-binding protein LolD n=1 Tax=Legionella pneumophila TaxID=446 RepID=A0A378K7W8_LEGPN|nr:lipoprotein-releasing ABC transporter ATP-binding protein LolD [Legionella pneumophila]MCW8468155.1 lipoprotein-releasing ABC transporter ATP-binding protein LolD [Legionella pneumophila]MCW8477824.1 lipoprotein-releasing ABC transporter ATP-binding protein LolD [Legionella pneumophila]MCZ4681919.1 lipoprotein-releasing ABC transporter ATP-binding protein LolD [Legionella pneumophila]MCZ4708201.1 lipoprotein-releasing ABC transporter ATP-binding protein LolD [Legionella pneumophila]MCZ47171